VRTTVDEDGVRTVEDGRLRQAVRVIGVAAVGVVVATVLAIVAIRRSPQAAGRRDVVPPAGEEAAPPVADVPAAARPPHAVPSAPASSTPRAPVRAARKKGLPPPAAEEPPPPRELSAKDVIPALRAAGETGGIAAFPLPGTKPTKTGIVVPDDFELPEGYVRHYQTTDDGKQLPPILMVHPDYALVDASGQPVATPEDGVVPPELAPPGLPVRMLEVPDASRR
jgi:hypothetical protein